MLENVKKCKNFLATLIKLASGSGPQATEMGQNVTKCWRWRNVKKCKLSLPLFSLLYFFPFLCIALVQLFAPFIHQGQNPALTSCGF